MGWVLQSRAMALLSQKAGGSRFLGGGRRACVSRVERRAAGSCGGRPALASRAEALQGQGPIWSQTLDGLDFFTCVPWYPRKNDGPGGT